MTQLRYSLANWMCAVAFLAMALAFGRLFSWNVKEIHFSAAVLFIAGVAAIVTRNTIRRWWTVFAVSGCLYLLAIDFWLRQIKYGEARFVEIKWFVEVDGLWQRHSLIAFIVAVVVATLAAVLHAPRSALDDGET